VVYNKIDLQGLEAGIKRDEYGKISSIHLSAITGAGLADLRTALVEVRDTPELDGQMQDWHPLNDN
jgi:GTP-binding protein HflX